MLDLKDGARFGNSVLAPTFLGNLDAAYITSGTLPTERLPSTLGNASTLYIGNGAGLVGIQAENVLGLDDFSSNSVTANYFYGNGSSLGNLSASSITSGVFNTNYLPSTIEVAHVVAQDFTGNIEVANLEFLIESGGYFEANVGNISKPSYAFDTDASTGIYRPEFSTIGFVSNGLHTAQLSSTGLVVNANITANYLKGNGSMLTGIVTSGGQDGTSNASNITSGILAVNRGGTGVTNKSGNGNVVLSNDPVLYGNVTVIGNVTATGYYGNIDVEVGNFDIMFDSGSYFEANVGNVIRPGYSFDMDTSTGMYTPEFSTIGFVSNGVEIAQMTPTGLTVNGNVSASGYTGNIDLGNLDIIFDSGGYFEANNGNTTHPGYSFDMDTSTGFYRPLANTIGFVTGGVETAQVSSNGILVNGDITGTYLRGNGSFITGLEPSLTISNVQITDSNWTVLDDTAVTNSSTTYLLVNGSNFMYNGSLVKVGGITASSTSHISSGQLRAALNLSSLSSGSYDVTVLRPDSKTAVKSHAVTVSPIPIWSTESNLGNITYGTAFSIALSAIEYTESPVTYTNTSILPPSTSLSSNGILTGNVIETSNVLYTFSVEASDQQLQSAMRSFSLNYLYVFDSINQVKSLFSSNGTYNIVVDGIVRSVFCDLTGSITGDSTGWMLYQSFGTNNYQPSLQGSNILRSTVSTYGWDTSFQEYFVDQATNISFWGSGSNVGYIQRNTLGFTTSSITQVAIKYMRDHSGGTVRLLVNGSVVSTSTSTSTPTTYIGPITTTGGTPLIKIDEDNGIIGIFHIFVK